MLLVLAVGTIAASASARDHGDHGDRGGHRGGDRGYGWSGGYYPAPPVVYGSPYYAPPVVYGPAVGITVPGIRIGIR